MEKIDEIVREVAAEMLNTSMQEITAEVINGWATRLGATCKESLQVGNAAAMREALRKCANYLDVGDAGLCKGECDALREVMQEALSAPPRNCDLYTKDEVRLAYHLHGDGLMTMQAFSDWLFAEAKGENK